MRNNERLSSNMTSQSELW